MFDGRGDRMRRYLRVLHQCHKRVFLGTMRFSVDETGSIDACDL